MIMMTTQMKDEIIVVASLLILILSHMRIAFGIFSNYSLTSSKLFVNGSSSTGFGEIWFIPSESAKSLSKQLVVLQINVLYIYIFLC